MITLMGALIIIARLDLVSITEASRRCPLTGILRDLGVLFWGHLFEASASGILTFRRPKRRLGAAPDRPDPVCLSVCLLSASFSGTLFWSRSMDVQLSFHKKDTPKRGSGSDICRGSWSFLTHLAEVVALSSSGDCPSV